MNTRCLVLSVVVLSFFSGCSYLHDDPRTVVLKHPVTLDFVDCKVDQWETSKSYKDNQQCIEDYKKKGYVVWGKID